MTMTGPRPTELVRPGQAVRFPDGFPALDLPPEYGVVLRIRDHHAIIRSPNGTSKYRLTDGTMCESPGQRYLPVTTRREAEQAAGYLREFHLPEEADLIIATLGQPEPAPAPA